MSSLLCAQRFGAETSNASVSSTKVKVKAVCGSYSTAALWHIVLLPEGVPSFISRGAAHTKRRKELYLEFS
jgi:hypothetical protein